MPPLLMGLVLVVARMDKAEGETPLGSPRPFGQGKASRAEEFDRTGVLQPDNQITATLRPGNQSEFYYLIPREGTPFTLLVSPCTGSISWTVSYTRPPENEPNQDESNPRIQWPVTKLVPESPLFAYTGFDTRNFTLESAKAGVYRFEIRTVALSPDLDGSHPVLHTVRLYATTDNLEELSPIGFRNGLGKRRHLLRFRQRRSKRRLGVSWTWSRFAPNATRYCLAVTSGTLKPPATMCAAENLLRAKLAKRHQETANYGNHRTRRVPEGLHCPREPRLTLNGMKFNTTYHFALYAVSTRSNVSNRVTVESHKFRRNPTQTLRVGRPETANLRKNNGSLNFQYRPRNDTATVFLIRSCGGGAVRARLKGPGLIREEESTGGTLKLNGPPLSSGKRYLLRLSTMSPEQRTASTVKVVAREDTSLELPRSSHAKKSRRNQMLENRSNGDSSWSKSSQRFKSDRWPTCSVSRG